MGGDSECLMVWGVTLSGLLCVGDKITAKIVSGLCENSLVFKLRHHYFVCNQCLKEPRRQERYLEVPYITLESCKSSYDRSSLRKLAVTLRALKQIEVSNSQVKKDISERMEPGQSGQMMNPSSVSATLRQQIFSVKPKHPATKVSCH